ncbi:tetratricopeptide repeat protein [Kangiella marina]|uniref:MalT-like TPR region domain-containing protein n=1 Tax=Kangiella marina TaxID=1079178 RepID=A0ABP8IIM8_9GAMM
MNVKKLISGIALYLLTKGLIGAGYYNDLKAIESQRIKDLSGTKQSLQEISKYKSEFSDSEKHLYWLLMAHSATMESDFAEAERLLLKIINSDADIDYKGRAHSVFAAVLQLQGEYVRSYLHLDKALRHVPRMDNEEYKANILQNAVSFYNDSGMFDYAMDHARRLLKLGVQRKDLSNQCQAHFEMMFIELSANKYELAEDRLTKTDNICNKANETLFLLHLPNVRADLAIQKGDTSRARKLLEENYTEVKKYGWKILSASTEIKLANLYSKIDEFKEAEKLALKALKASEEIGDIKRAKGATEILANIYSELGEKDKAIKYFLMYMELEKRLSASSRQRKLSYDQARQWLRVEQ